MISLLMTESSSVEYLHQKYMKARDISEFMRSLSMSDRDRLEEYIEKQQHSQRDEVQYLIEEEMRIVFPQRNTMKLIKLKVCDYPIVKGRESVCIEAYVTVWQPDDHFLSKVNEGCRIKVSDQTWIYLLFKLFQPSVCASQFTDKLNLKCISSKFNIMQVDPETIKLSMYIPRSFQKAKQITNYSMNTDIDMVVKIVCKSF